MNRRQLLQNGMAALLGKLIPGGSAQVGPGIFEWGVAENGTVWLNIRAIVGMPNGAHIQGLSVSDFLTVAGRTVVRDELDCPLVKTAILKFMDKEVRVADLYDLLEQHNA